MEEKIFGLTHEELRQYSGRLYWAGRHKAEERGSINMVGQPKRYETTDESPRDRFVFRNADELAPSEMEKALCEMSGAQIDKLTGGQFLDSDSIAVLTLVGRKPAFIAEKRGKHYLVHGEHKGPVIGREHHMSALLNPAFSRVQHHFIDFEITSHGPFYVASRGRYDARPDEYFIIGSHSITPEDATEMRGFRAFTVVQGEEGSRELAYITGMHESILLRWGGKAADITELLSGANILPADLRISYDKDKRGVMIRAPTKNILFTYLATKEEGPLRIIYSA